MNLVWLWNPPVNKSHVEVVKIRMGPGKAWTKFKWSWPFGKAWTKFKRSWPFGKAWTKFKWSWPFRKAWTKLKWSWSSAHLGRPEKSSSEVGPVPIWERYRAQVKLVQCPFGKPGQSSSEAGLVPIRESLNKVQMKLVQCAWTKF